MLAVVKTPHIEARLNGLIPRRVLAALQEEYGNYLEIIEDDDDILEIAQETDWYKQAAANSSPAWRLNTLRWKHQITQAELARRLGMTRQTISAIERGRRGIGPDMARKLAAALDCSPEQLMSK
jgi:DNA-binding XRE family transcriptional regulator